jgi:hypothetical protein
MTETKTKAVAPEAQATDPDDDTELELRTWGLSGQPSSWALSSWVTTIEVIRQANKGLVPLSAVQAVLDASFPGRGYLAANVALAHVPGGAFTWDGDGLEVTFNFDGDQDLDLPDECSEWDFGDGTQEFRESVSTTHTYARAGTYTARLTIRVGGVDYTSTEDITLDGQVAPVLTSLEPATAAIGGPDFTLRVHGTGFNEESVIVWNGADEPTTLESDVVVTTIVKPSMVAAAVDLPVHVRNGDELSNALGFSFTGIDPVPDPQQGGECYDPGAHTVGEVLEYAADHPDEVDDILERERNGKNRSTLVDALEDLC